MENIKIMFRSSRFVTGFVCVLLVVAFALVWPLINTTDPKSSRKENPLYHEVTPLREALIAEDDAEIDRQMALLAEDENEEIQNMLAAMHEAMEEGVIAHALSGAKQVKKSNPLYGEFSGLRQSLEDGDEMGAREALAGLEAHQATIDSVAALVEEGNAQEAIAAIGGEPALAEELAPLLAALEAGDAQGTADELAAMVENHAKTFGWVEEVTARLNAGGYQQALDAMSIIPRDYLVEKDQPPSREFPLGTDNFSTDMLLKLAYGTRASLYVGLLAGCIATVIGLTLGLLAGYVGGLLDNIVSTITNMFIVIPSMIVLILISVALGTTSSMTVTGVIIGLTAWPWTARGVRAQTTSLRNRDHVNMARIAGYSTPHIILTEILPYIASYAVMAFILQMASGITAEATLTLLGLGDPTTVTLGKLLNWAIAMDAIILGRWWQFVPVAGFIAVITFGLYMMNSGMDEVFNPKIRS